MSGHSFLSRGILTLFTSVLGFALPAPANAAARVSESYGKLPLHFEANQGQAHENVRFLSRGPGYSLYLTAGEAVLELAKPNSAGKLPKQSARAEPEAQVGARAAPVALRMSLVGANRKPLVSGREELPGKANYFIGKDPSKWRTNVPTYAKVHYREVYPGIDVVYYGNQRQLEYDFIVAPGADPKKIVLGFKGADWLEIDAEGDLVLHAPGGAIRQKKPVIYQEVDGVRQEVAGSYVRKGAKRVGFKVAAYDTSRPLVIDPLVLSYSTYLGGRSAEWGPAIAVDSAGNAYVTGTTSSPDFPTTPGALKPTASTFFGEVYAFVTKLNPTGSALVYSTYLGGEGFAEGFGIAVDVEGSAYVTGRDGLGDFPTTAGAFQTTGAGVFIAKLHPTGSALVYSTYLGSFSGAEGRGIAVDANGNAYVTGNTSSSVVNNIPTTPGAFQRTIGSSVKHVFVTKLNPTGSALVYSTFLGEAISVGIAVDADGNAYVTGSTIGSTNFPTVNAFQGTSDGGVDAFVTKLNPTGSALVYSTYLGGSNRDVGSGIAVDSNGNAYVTGSTRSTNFPTTLGAFQPISRIENCLLYPQRPEWDSSDCRDAFVTKVNPTGSSLVYSTYLGSSGDDVGFGIAVDANGNAYVTGMTISLEEIRNCSTCPNDFPTTPGTFQYGRNGDAFVTKLDPAGSALIYSTYLGGIGGDAGLAIAVDAADNAYVRGMTSGGFPTTAGAFQPTHGGNNDAFVAKIVDDTPPSTRFEETAAAYMGYWPSYGAETGTFSGRSIVASNQTTATATFTFTGTAVTWIGVRCDVCGIATVSIDGGVPTVVNTAGPGSGSLASEPVFSASGLAPGVNHTLVITVTGATTSADKHVAVDAFDVTVGGDAAPPPPPPPPAPGPLPPLPPLPLPPLPPLPVVPPLLPVLGL